MVNLNKCLTGPMSCLLTMLLLIYIISPVDLMPEILLGPLGFLDDLLAFGGLIALHSKTLFKKGRGLFGI